MKQFKLDMGILKKKVNMRTGTESISDVYNFKYTDPSFVSIFSVTISRVL